MTSPVWQPGPPKVAGGFWIEGEYRWKKPFREFVLVQQAQNGDLRLPEIDGKILRHAGPVEVPQPVSWEELRMRNVIKHLRRWSELEPERCKLVQRKGTYEGDNWFKVGESFFRSDDPIQDPQDGWVLCGLIEAAIVERVWRVGQKVWDETGRWDVVIEPVRGRFFMKHATAPTKFEALLTAYVQALEAIK